AMGYSDQQVADLQETINAAAPHVDAFIIGTPIDLRRLCKFPKPAVRVTYDLEEKGQPDLAEVLKPIIAKARR
ncbi:MAG TPA: GTPase, partial [Acidobacteriota bacterium]|nr:GTPase [Acidobacteriota bacterium]